MPKFAVGSEVKIRQHGKIGTVASFDGELYRVDWFGANGDAMRHHFEPNELEAVDDEGNGAATGDDAGVASAPQSSDSASDDKKPSVHHHYHGSLIGSSIQPAEFELASTFEHNGKTIHNGVQLREVVRRAWQASGLTVEAWNEQPDETREASIAAVVSTLDLKKSDADGEQENPTGAAASQGDSASSEKTEGQPAENAAAQSSESGSVGSGDEAAAQNAEAAKAELEKEEAA